MSKKQNILATSVTEKEKKYLQEKVDEGLAMNMADLLRTIIRDFIKDQKLRETHLVSERKNHIKL